MFEVGNLLVGLQDLEDTEIMGEKVFFLQFLQALARENGHFDNSSSVAEVGEKS